MGDSSSKRRWWLIGGIVAAVRRDDEPKGPKGPIRLRACGIWRMVSAWAHEMWRSGLDDDGQQPWQLGGDTSRGQGGAAGRRGQKGRRRWRRWSESSSLSPTGLQQAEEGGLGARLSWRLRRPDWERGTSARWGGDGERGLVFLMVSPSVPFYRRVARRRPWIGSASWR